ncbi:MAG: DMT family transporter [Bacteroidia bacterium]|nr:DMT family transporter [Bacteroidia bacterium]MDW8159718.1 DMT family transporter [Bacteroidia bacterium]
MFSALLCIAASTSLLFILRLAKAARISLFPMIVTNYVTCVLCGFYFVPSYFQEIYFLPTKIPLAIGWLHGLLFVSLFLFIGKASQQIGVAYTAMITRISVVFPTLLSTLVYQEAMETIGWIGMLLALIAVFFLHWDYLKGSSLEARAGLKRVILSSALLFLGTGIADSIFKIVDFHFGSQIGVHVYTLTIFQSAASAGSLVLLFYLATGRLKVKAKDILWGVALGLPNYFSVVFLFWALEVLPGPVFFPINHIGVLLLATIVSVFYFRERLSFISWMGVVLAIIAILLMARRQFIELIF